MTPEIEAQYQAIADVLRQALDDRFATSWVYAEMLEGTGVTSAYYEDAAGALHFLDDDMVNLALYRAFAKLRQLWSAEFDQAWSTATYTVGSDGKFAIDFGYADVSDAGLTFERRDNWERQQFGDRKISTVSAG